MYLFLLVSALEIRNESLAGRILTASIISFAIVQFVINPWRKIKRRKRLAKLRWLIKLLFRRKNIRFVQVLTFILGAAAIVGLILALGWIPGLAVILGIYLFTILVFKPVDQGTN